MRDHGARQQIELRGRGESATAVLQQLPIAQHGLQSALQRLQAVGSGQLQGLGDVLLGLRAIGVAQEQQQAFTAHDRVFILLLLAMVMRVGGLAVRRCGLLSGAAARSGLGLRARFRFCAGIRCLAGGGRARFLHGIRHPSRQTGFFAVFMGFLHTAILHPSPN